MALLKYNSAWTADEQTIIINEFNLNEQLADRLFVKHKDLNVKSLSDEELAAKLEEILTPAVETETETETPEVPAETEEEEEEKVEHDTAKEADIIDAHTATQRDSAALTAAKIVDDKVTTLVNEGFVAQGKVKITPLLVHQALVAAAKAAKIDLSSFPYPNSLLEKGKTVVGTGKSRVELGNEPYDRYTFMARKPGADKETKQNGSFYKTQYEKSKAGIAMQAEIDFATKCMANYSSVGVNSDVLGKYKGKTLTYIGRVRKAMESNKVYAINRLRDAIKHDRQLHAFSSIPKHEGAPFVKFETEKMEDGTRVFLNKFDPVSLYYWGYVDDESVEKRELVPFHSGDVSLASFWRFNVAKAIQTAGGPDKVTLQHVLDTVKRQPKQGATPAKPEGQDEWSKHDVTNIRQFENVINGMLPWIDPEKRDEEARVDAAILKRSTEPDGDEFVMSLGKAELAINRAMSVLRERFDNLMMNSAKVEQQEKQKTKTAA